VSRTLEEFYTVRCQVADMRNLYESLDEVTVKDTLEGDNMYTCSQCGKKVRAEKRLVILQELYIPHPAVCMFPPHSSVVVSFSLSLQNYSYQLFTQFSIYSARPAIFNFYFLFKNRVSIVFTNEILGKIKMRFIGFQENWYSLELLYPLNVGMKLSYLSFAVYPVVVTKSQTQRLRENGERM